MDKFTKPRETRVGKLTEAARERLQAAINGELSHKINGTIKAKDVRESIENSRKFGNGISPDLISDFLSPSPSADRKFTKAKILFDCLGLSLTEGSDDWIPKQQATARSSTPSSPSMDWLDRCQTLLADRRLTSNALGLGETRSLDAIHVPLGLMERKQQPRVEREPDPAMGSQLYQQPELREVKRFEHEAFLKDVVQDRACGKHIAIIGEPGAGKTTLLTKIGEWLVEHPGDAEVIAWISLADLQGKDLSEYFCCEWLKRLHPSSNPPAEWRKQLERKIEERKVWLLLDGLDEMAAGNVLHWIDRQLDGWGNNLRAVLTCRLNLWDGGGNRVADRFDVFHTLDYSEDQVKQFISNWFSSQPETANALRAALNETGKERIKDLVKNPLRLTLLCSAWRDDKGLPDTQAGLYDLFVEWFYRSNAEKSLAEVAKQDRLNKNKYNAALGSLAKQGLNRAEELERRFRFTLDDTISACQDDGATLDALQRLGWLNCVGVDECDRKVYAFFHPTFQEYFAACSIEDWDYFLPRAHVDRPVCCEGEDVPTYRVFEQEWRQTILLWIGRGDVGDELKEKFIEKLTNFQEQEEEFYYYRAYCMAAICVGEFKDSRLAESIISQIFKWAFGYFNTEKHKWQTYVESLSSLSQKIIPFTHHTSAILAFVVLFGNLDLDDNSYWGISEDMEEVFSQIARDNPQAISALVTLLANADLDNLLRLRVARTLENISAGNPEAIAALLALFAHDNLKDRVRYSIALAVRDIDSGNPEAIAALIALLRNDNSLRLSAVVNLGETAVGNPQAISALIALLANADEGMHYATIRALDKIAVGNPEAIAVLIARLANEDCYQTVQTLSKIAVGNPQAIAALTTMLNADVDNSVRCNAARVLGKIDVGNPEAIAALVALLSNADLSCWQRCAAADDLGNIDLGNPEAIAALLSLLANTDVHDSVRCNAAMFLGEIALGNSGAIAALMALLDNSADLSDLLYYRVAGALWAIDSGNLKAIAALLALLSNTDLDNSMIYAVGASLMQIGDLEVSAAFLALLLNADLDNSLRCYAARCLDEIAVGNPEASAALVTLLSDDNLDDSLFSSAAGALCKTLTGEQMPSAIWKLKKYVIDAAYKSSDERFESCFKILLQCAQILTYPEFHTAWHSSLPTIPTNLETLPHQLNRPNTIYIPYLAQPNEIAQQLANCIFLELNPTHIPEVQTIPQLQRHLLQLRSTPHLVILINNPHPTTELITAISSLHTPNQIQIIWLTTVAIPNALPIDQPDLVAAIQSAIDRFIEA